MTILNISNAQDKKLAKPDWIRVTAPNSREFQATRDVLPQLYYTHLFSDNLRFDRPRTRMIFSADCLDLPIKRSPACVASIRSIREISG